MTEDRPVTTDRTWAWRITDQTPERARLSTGLQTFAETVPEWEVADRIVDAVRRQHPACGVLDVLLWMEDSPLGSDNDHLSPWESDRNPYGDDRAPADAAVFAYSAPDDRAPAARTRADNLAAALNRYDEAATRIKVAAVNAVAARLDAETT
ncbi:hypothetical protein [Streptomyces sp. NPDC051662]|uniref:hypothetical protein n=1 Tax=Streptomyces sp. NPDC051662 TaxID=3154750 RepID=UPI003417DF25